MYSPVPSLLVVDAHPTTKVITMAKKKAVNALVVNFMVALFISGKSDDIKNSSKFDPTTSLMFW